MSTGATPPPSGGTSALKIVVPLVALVCVVFAITYLGESVPPDPLGNLKGDGPRTEAKSAEPPLRFFTSLRRYDPPAPDAPGYRGLPLLAPSAVAAPPDPLTGDVFGYRLQDRTFQGFYESGDTVRRTQFWFENRNPAAVALQLLAVSCTSCSGASVAPIPTETTKKILQNAALSSLPVGPFHAFTLGMTEPAAELTKLQWQHAQFANDPRAAYTVPAAPAPDKWAASQWGILELNFKVRPNGKIPLEAQFGSQVQGTQQRGAHPFALFFEVSPASEASRTAIEVGELDPLSGTKEFEFIVFSNTRGPGSEFGDLTPPVAAINFPNGTTDTSKFFEVTKVVRFSGDELTAMTDRLFRELKKPVQVRAAYRVTLTVRPKVGDQRLDIGFIERNLVFDTGLALRLTATVRGQVWLDDKRTSVALPTFVGSRGLEHAQTVNTVKGADVRVLRDESTPMKYGYALEKLPDVGTEGRYKLTITIPPGTTFGQIKGEVVLEVQGPQPQKVRIPVSGSATF